MANDYVINGMLVRDKIGKMPTKKVLDPNEKDEDGATAQRVGLYDERYLDWTSEAVYDDLEKRKVKKQMTLDVHIEMGDDGKNGKGGKGSGDSNGNGKIPVKIDAEGLKKLRE